MSEKQTFPDTDPLEITTTVEIAEMLGISTRTVQRWCVSGKLKHKRIGLYYAFLWQDFIAFWNEYKLDK